MEGVGPLPASLKAEILGAGLGCGRVRQGEPQGWVGIRRGCVGTACPPGTGSMTASTHPHRAGTWDGSLDSMPASSMGGSQRPTTWTSLTLQLISGLIGRWPWPFPSFKVPGLPPPGSSQDFPQSSWLSGPRPRLVGKGTDIHTRHPVCCPALAPLLLPIG